MAYSHLDHLDTLKNSTSDAMLIALEAPEGPLHFLVLSSRT